MTDIQEITREDELAERSVTPTFTVPEGNLIAGLLKERIAHIEGMRLLAQRAFDDARAQGRNLPGSQRKKAVRHIEEADDKLAVAEGAYDEVRAKLRAENVAFEDDDE